MKLPKGWKVGCVSDFGRIVTGSTPSTADVSNFGGCVPFVTPGDLGGASTVTRTERTLTRAGAEKCRMVTAGSTLVVCIGSTIGKLGFAGCEVVTNQQINAVIPKADVCGRFAYYEIARISGDFNRLAGTQAVPILSKGEFGDFPVAIPPLPEQRKIADILSTWDKSVENLDALIAAKERRKKGLMQQLLTGKRRVKGAAAWKVTRLSEVAEERIARNRENFDRSRLYAVTKAEGMVPMRERVQGATVERCKVVEKGWFAYNPMRINIGSIARWEGTDPVMVSGDYVVFSTDEKRLLSDYLNHVRRSSAWSGFVGSSGNGSVRIRIWFDDLGHFKFLLPPVKEQRAIADILDTCDDELRLLRDQRAAIERQKRGLMQRLLTGKVRVDIKKGGE